MSNHTLTRLTQLHAKTGAVLEFAQRPQDEQKSHTLRNIAIGAGGLAAAGGVGLALRGRHLRRSMVGPQLPQTLARQGMADVAAGGRDVGRLSKGMYDKASKGARNVYDAASAKVGQGYRTVADQAGKVKRRVVSRVRGDRQMTLPGLG